ncbi:MAG: hypothetical protein J0M24_23565 [Verrucomicrobia bacterium]|nr:hypothetical protein [Verrucomicrobiota bacterium]
MQSEFNFDSNPAAPDGLAAWRRDRDQQRLALARANGLPLNHRCRVTLLGDVVLEGFLRLAEEELFLHEPTRDLRLRLQIDRCSFTPREILSLVRLD